ncbi:MAG: polysaccharide biosynthesis C-terminal domain-containing protein [Lewinellaceae bacterium]|nr:polysaccharide biosynthesis C-terminal domain-containing protein [Lewinellaceae bacterium]
MLLFCGLLLWGDVLPGPVTVYRFAWAQTISLAVTLLLVFGVLRSKVVLTLFPGWLHNWRAARPALLFMLKESFPYALVVLLMSAYTRLDGVLLERLLPDGKVHADVYAGAYRLLDAANMLGFLFASLLLPMFARMLRSGEPVRPLVSLSFRLILVGSLTLSSTVFFARKELVELMMPARAIPYRWETLGILIWTFVPVSATYIFSTLLTSDKRLMQMNRFFLVGIALDVVLNLVLVPRFHAIGSAWATLGTQSFVALAMIGLCLKFYGFWPSFSGVLRVVVYVALLLGTEYWLFNGTPWVWWMQLGVALLASLALALLTGMIRKSDRMP